MPMNNLPNPFEDEDVRAQFDALKDVEVKQPERVDPEPQTEQETSAPEPSAEEPQSQPQQNAGAVTVEVPEEIDPLSASSESEGVRGLAKRASERLGMRSFTSDQAPEVFRAAADTNNQDSSEAIIRLLEELPVRIAQELNK